MSQSRVSWTRDSRDRQRRLEKILASLDRVQRPDIQALTLTDEQYKKMGIELFDLDFKTGETSSSVTPYFMPANDGALAIPTPIDDDFTRYDKSKRRRIYKDHERPSYLANTFGNHARKVQEHTGLTSRWRYIFTTRTKRGRLLSGGLNVATATEFDSKRHPHRTLVAILEQYAQECRPSVGELIVLISWMLGGMRHQDIEKASRPKDKPLRFHKTFPTLVYSFMRPARARVLYGYFEDNKLKVVTTMAQDFDAPNYDEMMNSLLKWSSPIISGNTEVKIPLSSITEDEENE